MTENQSILIKNIYYMLTYAFRVLKQTNYDEIASENFSNIHNLFAAILSKGIAQQLKQGLHREYMSERDSLTVLRGKLEIYGTFSNKLMKKRVLVCDYDELSENNLINRILKTTATILFHQADVDLSRKKELKNVLLFLDSIDPILPSSIKWNRLCFQRNNQSYQMLIFLCYFALQGLLLTTEKGTYKMAAFLDDQRMSQLYERFILEYYRFHHPDLHASASQIEWNLDDGKSEYLPVMQTDIVLKRVPKTLIIDAKYYRHTMQSQFDKQTLHSSNLYQIFTYVKNMDKYCTGNVTGMLLYAKTTESITPDSEFLMSGNKIAVKTLDLNIDFSYIAEQLDRIVPLYL